jgi:hypothetical protein
MGVSLDPMMGLIWRSLLHIQDRSTAKNTLPGPIAKIAGEVEPETAS